MRFLRKAIKPTLLLFYAFTLFSCKKSSVSPFVYTKAGRFVTMLGSWSLSGTDRGCYGVKGDFEREKNFVVNLLQVDSVTYVMQSGDDFGPYSSAMVASAMDDSTITLVAESGWNTYGDLTLKYNFLNNTLSYNGIYYHNSVNFEYEILFSSSHTNLINGIKNANLLKIGGVRQWHGTYYTNYFNGLLGFVDTTYPVNKSIQIYLINDSLIVAKHLGNPPSYEVLRLTENNSESITFQEPHSEEQLIYYTTTNTFFLGGGNSSNYVKLFSH